MRTRQLIGKSQEHRSGPYITMTVLKQRQPAPDRLRPVLRNVIQVLGVVTRPSPEAIAGLQCPQVVAPLPPALASPQQMLLPADALERTVAAAGAVVAHQSLAAVATQPPLESDDPLSNFRAGLVGNVVRCPRLLDQTGHVILSVTTQPLPDGVP